MVHAAVISIALTAPQPRATDTRPLAPSEPLVFVRLSTSAAPSVRAAARGARSGGGVRLARAARGAPKMLPATPVVEFDGLDLPIGIPDPDAGALIPVPDEFGRGRLLEGIAELVRRGGFGAPYLDTEVERRPMALPGNPEPEYPASLLRRGVQGRVEVQFVIDTSGAADLHSMRVLQSADSLFTHAVAAVLPRMRFLAGEYGGRKVKVVVSQAFTFVVR
ncbi:MAG TPA: TonB family protein [Gemmatimonadaceae bacterium]|nr:TonB family protein [Gemmatimonadaceae bacterium]